MLPFETNYETVVQKLQNVRAGIISFLKYLCNAIAIDNLMSSLVHIRNIVAI